MPDEPAADLDQAPPARRVVEREDRRRLGDGGVAHRDSIPFGRSRSIGTLLCSQDEQRVAARQALRRCTRRRTTLDPESRTHPRRGLERRLDRVAARVVTPRGAVVVIATTTIVVTAAAAILMTLVDEENYPSIGSGLWWAIQTTTTVGYGDNVPTTAAGRVVASLVMLFGIGFLTVITAAITSTFVARSRVEQMRPDGATPDGRAVPSARRAARANRSAVADLAARADEMPAAEQLRQLDGGSSESKPP